MASLLPILTNEEVGVCVCVGGSGVRRGGGRPSTWASRIDHREDASAESGGEVGPRADHAGEVRVGGGFGCRFRFRVLLRVL
jgi:hypothetical protein